ncbi:MAG: type I methionyl aminopeptidase [Candidatus Manganitrophus sp.]|nr:type I methionyl aminopeptidase [Candidatus Manganitrophus sp.]WDT71545.1 MAG: type I methionyl aminopeptidase [Candidatus Manganitrophus sp.]WDT76206.1 MAG: type I methionyl aminopeptidase [Candidatus Manganitrophus sp.]WDT81121.1 MAG: type I methionyl aminopeptidase [Candidatus Manganitrophus sp.]
MIILKSKEEVAKIAKASRIVAESLEAVRAYLKPGMTTKELDLFVEKQIRERGGTPAFKGYRNYPATLCISVNEEVVHGIPSPDKVIKEGDIVGLDLGAIYDGFYGDSAVTVAVGEVKPEAKRLIQVTEESLYAGIAQACEGSRLSDISHAVQSHVEQAGFSVVTDFVGHGIGRALHEEPQIPNFGPPGRGPRLREGMVLAIEPMVNMGKAAVRVLDDRWTAVTADGSLSAHFEHTIAVTKEGPVILSKL